MTIHDGELEDEKAEETHIGIRSPSKLLRLTGPLFLELFLRTSDLRASLSYNRDRHCPFGPATAEDSRRGGAPRHMTVAGPPPGYSSAGAIAVRDPSWRMMGGIHAGNRCWMERFNHNLGLDMFTPSVAIRWPQRLVSLDQTMYLFISAAHAQDYLRYRGPMLADLIPEVGQVDPGSNYVPYTRVELFPDDIGDERIATEIRVNPMGIPNQSTISDLTEDPHMIMIVRVGAIITKLSMCTCSSPITLFISLSPYPSLSSIHIYCVCSDNRYDHPNSSK